MYLARRDTDTDTERTQTLAAHSHTVAQLCRTYGEQINCPNLAELSGYLHDMGKAKTEFQNYLLNNDTSLRGKINHSSAGAQYIIEKYGNTQNLYQKITAQIIAIAILSHHTGLIDCLTIDGEDNFSKRIHPEKDIHYSESKNNYLKEILTEEKINELFTNAVTEITAITNRYKGKPELRFQLGLITRHLLSCLIDADRYDSYCFKEGIDTEDTDYQLETAWSKLLSNLENALSNFKQTTPIEKERNNISISCEAAAEHAPGVYRLYVPTGGGKTLSSLRYALEHARKYGKSHIYYAIPYTTIIEQNAKEIRSKLMNEDMILEHHSNIIQDDESMSHTSDEVDKRELLTERWDTPIILTTTVQMLNTLFLGKNSAVRRMHNLANSIIIFDEVQTIPLKTLNLFTSAMNYLAEICKTTIILCTATQPELENTSKPIRLSEPANLIDNYADLFKKFIRVKIHDKVPNNYNKEQIFSNEALAEFVLEKTQRSTLIILNTIKAAQDLYITLKNTTNDCYYIYYLSTRLCPAHRMDILGNLTNKLKQKETLDKPIICISTQLIEAGVDISFDVVIRSLAGLDSIAQAAGRCNRNGEEEFGNVYIILHEYEDLKSNPRLAHYLPEIERGQETVRKVLREFPKYPTIYGETLLDPKTISKYYSYYYNNNTKLQMDYLIPEKESNFYTDTTLYDLLSTNKIGCDATNLSSDKKQRLNQAFKTAGSLFHVIDSDTISVIVPYGNGNKIIKELLQDKTLSQMKKHLRNASMYIVNLFLHKNQLEENGISQIGDTGVYYLNHNDIYTTELGFVRLKNGELINLIY